MTAPIADYLSMQGWDGLSVRFFVHIQVGKFIRRNRDFPSGLNSTTIALYSRKYCKACGE
jgi:hypothetical protein